MTPPLMTPATRRRAIVAPHRRRMSARARYHAPPTWAFDPAGAGPSRVWASAARECGHPHPRSGRAGLRRRRAVGPLEGPAEGFFRLVPHAAADGGHAEVGG